MPSGPARQKMRNRSAEFTIKYKKLLTTRHESLDKSEQ